MSAPSTNSKPLTRPAPIDPSVWALMTKEAKDAHHALLTAYKRSTLCTNPECQNGEKDCGNGYLHKKKPVVQAQPAPPAVQAQPAPPAVQAQPDQSALFAQFAAYMAQQQAQSVQQVQPVVQAQPVAPVVQAQPVAPTAGAQPQQQQVQPVAPTAVAQPKHAGGKPQHQRHQKDEKSAARGPNQAPKLDADSVRAFLSDKAATAMLGDDMEYAKALSLVISRLKKGGE